MEQSVPACSKTKSEDKKTIKYGTLQKVKLNIKMSPFHGKNNHKQG